MDWRSKVRTIADFPAPGVLFRDVLPVMAEAAAFRGMIGELSDRARRFNPDVVVAPEARGFLIGAPLALELGVGMVPVRKPGKLPGPVLGQDYALEYGKSRLEASAATTLPGLSALVVDDVLATGGTVEATARLVQDLGGRLAGFLFLIELTDLKGRDRLVEASRAIPSRGTGGAIEALWTL